MAAAARTRFGRAVGTTRGRDRRASVQRSAVGAPVRAAPAACATETLIDVERELRDEAAAAGIPIPADKAIPDDGRFLRYGRPNRRASDNACFARLGIGYSGRPYGVAGCNATELLVRAPKRRDHIRIIDPTERRRMRIERDRVERTRQAGERVRRNRAIERIRIEYGNATPCDRHAYLERKGVAAVPGGLRVDRHGRLLVPRRDASGRLVALQRIGTDDSKRYSAGTPPRGTLFGIGRVDPDGLVLIAEGLATGLTVHAETGHPVAVAFDAGNLEPVARALRVRYPHVAIVIAGDDDRQRDDNPGRTKAIAAALAVGGRVLLPDLCRCCTCTDHNDVAACRRRRTEGAR